MNIQAGATVEEEPTRISSVPVNPNFYPEAVTERRPETPLGADVAASLETTSGPVMSETQAVQSGASSGDRVGPVPRKISTHVSREARPSLVGDIAVLIEGLEGITLTAANRSQVPVSGINIGLKYLNKDRRRNPRIWVEVKTPPGVHPNQALALWDAIGLGIDRWLPRLRPRMRRLLEDQISLSVEWVEPDGRSV